MTLAEYFGYARSWIIYYGKPFNRFRLKRFYSSFIRRNDLVFDIGAHLGNRTEVFLALGAKTIAVEPQPGCIKYLKNKFKQDPNFELIEGVAGHSGDPIRFSINSISPTISTARDSTWKRKIHQYSVIKADWDTTIEVNSVTLNQLIEKNGMPTFCKIDTEGFEWEVLQGLSHPVPVLSIEYLAFDLERILQCIDKMNLLGDYKVNFSPGESQKWLWPVWISPVEMKQILQSNQLGYEFGDIYFAVNPPF